MAASPLNIDTKRLPLTPQWSPILSHSRSPSLTSPRSSEDLSSRCRKLARSFGESALVDDFEQASPKSPSRSRENSNEGGLPPSPLSPDRGQRHFHLPLSPPHPEGAHELNEILEEENESTPQQERMEEERGLGFESDVQTEGGEPIQFRLSPMIGNHLSLHEAGIAMRGDAHMGGVGGEGALGLTLHDRLRMDNQEYQESGSDYETKLRDQLKTGDNWIKVDLSLVDNELLVGTPDSQLNPSQSFSACFVDPLLKILSEASPNSPSPLFSHHRRMSSPPSPSIASPPSGLPTSRPLHLEITLHTNSSLSLQYLQASLQPLHDNHFLTTYCPNARLTSKAPIVIFVASSEGIITDHELEQLDTPRILYRRVTLDELFDSNSNGTINAQSHPIVSGNLPRYMRSTPSGTLSEETKETIEGQVKKAHEKGFLVKFEGVPKFPEHERKITEAFLRSIGVDHIA
ncbi:hypothetical protein JCM16303_007300 [Sporobolomyces ruberrimus]